MVMLIYSLFTQFTVKYFYYALLSIIENQLLISCKTILIRKKHVNSIEDFAYEVKFIVQFLVQIMLH